MSSNKTQAGLSWTLGKARTLADDTAAAGACGGPGWTARSRGDTVAARCVQSSECICICILLQHALLRALVTASACACGGACNACLSACLSADRRQARERI